MKKLFIFFLIITGLIANAQGTTPAYKTIKITGSTKNNDATRVMVQDSISKELHWVLKSSIGGGGGSSVVRQEFTWTAGSQIFTLTNNYNKILSVEVQGQGALSQSQYTLIAPNKIQILDELDIDDYVVILYSLPSSGGGAGVTDLSTTQTATGFTINSSAGTGALVPLGDGILAGASLNDYTTAEKIKLSVTESSANKQNSLVVDGTGVKYPTVDAVRAYVESKVPESFSKIVYVDSADPSTATIFDIVNPPVTNDDALKADVANLYIGADVSTWTYKTSPAGYVTKTVTPPVAMGSINWTTTNNVGNIYASVGGGTVTTPIANPVTTVIPVGVIGTINGAVTGTTSWAINGGGLVSLTGANTYTGQITVNGSSSLSLGSSFSAPMNGNGNVTYSNTGAATFTGTISNTGTTTIAGSGTGTFTGSWSGSRFVFNGTGITNFGANIASGISLTVNSGTNNFTNTIVSVPTVLIAGGTNVFSSGMQTITTTTISGGTNTFTGVGFQHNNPVSITGGTNNFNGGNTNAPPITIASGVAISVNPPAQISYPLHIGAITNAGIININSPAGTFAVSGWTWYYGQAVNGSGNVNFLTGTTLMGASAGNWASTGTATVAVGATLVSGLTAYTCSTMTLNVNGTYMYGGSTPSWAGLNGSGSIVNGNASSFGAIYIQGTGNYTYSGTIANGGVSGAQITMYGSGIQTLSGAINTTGAIINNGAGTLNLTGTMTGVGSSILCQGSNGTINITGNCSTVPVTNNGNVSAILSGGNATTGIIGALNMTATYQVNAISTTQASKLTCAALTSSTGFTIRVIGAMNAGTYPILVKTSGYSGTPTLGTNTTGRAVTFAWSGNTLNMILI